MFYSYTRTLFAFAQNLAENRQAMANRRRHFWVQLAKSAGDRSRSSGEIRTLASSEQQTVFQPKGREKDRAGASLNIELPVLARFRDLLNKILFSEAIGRELFKVLHKFYGRRSIDADGSFVRSQKIYLGTDKIT
jgi:hypothetical protein